MSTRGTLLEQFEAAARRHPDKNALVTPAGETTYGQLLSCVGAWEREVARLGFRSRERVVVSLDAYVDFVALWFALWRRGCVPVPVEASAPPAELANAVRESRAQRLVSSSAEHLASVGAITGRSEHPRLAPTLGVADLDTEPLELPDDIALFFYTSGTSGTPKCVMMDHSGMAANICDQISAYGLGPNDVCLTPVTPTTAAALATVIWPSVSAGGTALLLPGASAGRLLRTVSTARPTVFYAVPFVYRLFADAADLGGPPVWNGVRLCLSSSADLSGRVFDEFLRRTGQPIRSLYCSSEAGSCTYNASSDAEQIRTSVGTALPGVDVRVVDASGKPQGPGNEGEIMVTGTHLARGYVARPELQAKVFRDGWVATGDVGKLDAHGFLYLTGRLSETINVAGYLVNPTSVERVLASHPSVSEALVVGEEGRTRGSALVAYVVLRDGTSVPTPAELMRHCAAHLEHYKVVRRFTVVDSLPRGRYGKVRRTVVQNQPAVSAGRLPAAPGAGRPALRH